MDVGLNFEVEVVKAYNSYFAEHHIDALALRLEKGTKYSTQPCDVLVLSPNKSYYFAIECKSMALTDQKALYFSSAFSVPKHPVERHQIDRMHEFCEKSGMRGVLAVELHKKPEFREAFLIPLQEAYVLWRNGRPGIPLITVRKGTPLVWVGTYGKGRYSL